MRGLSTRQVAEGEQVGGVKAGARRALRWGERRQQKVEDLAAATEVDISGVQTVCLFLGPYRNLTTMTAAVLFLHPNCQVLNHARDRIFGDKRLDFLARYDDDTFDNFVRFAIRISGSGKGGVEGGSITKSHAFGEEYNTRAAFEASALDLVKPEVKALVWKESMATSNHIRDHKVDLDAVFDQNQRLRFLMPVRHPLDSAVSNIKTRNTRFLAGVNHHSSPARVADAILDEVAWFRSLQTRHPDRFFSFYEHDDGQATLVRMAEFLEIDPCDEWLANAGETFDPKKRYSEHPAELVAHYERSVAERFDDQPDVKDALLRFVPPSTA
jgi:hypothetical protein